MRLVVRVCLAALAHSHGAAAPGDPTGAAVGAPFLCAAAGAGWCEGLRGEAGSGVGLAGRDGRGLLCRGEQEILVDVVFAGGGAVVQ